MVNTTCCLLDTDRAHEWPDGNYGFLQRLHPCGMSCKHKNVMSQENVTSMTFTQVPPTAMEIEPARLDNYW